MRGVKTKTQWMESVLCSTLTENKRLYRHGPCCFALLSNLRKERHLGLLGNRQCQLALNGQTIPTAFLCPFSRKSISHRSSRSLLPDCDHRTSQKRVRCLFSSASAALAMCLPKLRSRAVSSVQRLGRRPAVPPAEQSLRAHQRHYHHQPQLQ